MNQACPVLCRNATHSAPRVKRASESSGSLLNCATRLSFPNKPGAQAGFRRFVHGIRPFRPGSTQSGFVHYHPPPTSRHNLGEAFPRRVSLAMKPANLLWAATHSSGLSCDAHRTRCERVSRCGRRKCRRTAGGVYCPLSECENVSVSTARQQGFLSP